MHSRSICSRVYILVTSCRRPSRPSTLTALVEGKVSAPASRADLDGDSIALVHDPVGVAQVQKRAQVRIEIRDHLVRKPTVALVEAQAVRARDLLAVVLAPQF